MGDVIDLYSEKEKGKIKKATVLKTNNKNYTLKLRFDDGSEEISNIWRIKLQQARAKRVKKQKFDLLENKWYL